MLSKNQLIPLLARCVRAGEYVFMWVSEEYAEAPVIAAEQMMLRENERKSNEIAQLSQPGAGHVFCIVKHKKKSTHKFLTYLTEKDALFSWLLQESEVETYLFVGKIKPPARFSQSSGHILCYIDAPPNELARKFQVEPFWHTTPQSSGWNKQEYGVLTILSYNSWNQCSTPPTPEMIFNQRRMKRYDLLKGLKMGELKI